MLPEMLVPDSLLEWAGIKPAEKPSSETDDTTTTTDADALEVKKQVLRDKIAEQEKEIAGGDLHTGFANTTSRQDIIDEAQKELTGLGVDDRKHRENKAELAAAKSGGMTMDEYIVSERGVADRTEDGVLVGKNKEEQLQLYEKFVKTLKTETAETISTKPLLEKTKTWVAKAQTDYFKHRKGTEGFGPRKRILDKIGRHLRGPGREMMLEALKGTELEKAVIKHTAGGLKGPADLSAPEFGKFKTPSGGLDMGKAASGVFSEASARSSPEAANAFAAQLSGGADQRMNTFNDITKKNQTLQQGQSGSPTVVSTIEVGPSSNVNNQGDAIIIPSIVSAPRLTTSLAKD